MVDAMKVSKPQLETLFRDLDNDGSNAIDVDELEVGMKRLGLHPKKGEARRLIAQYDLDGSGLIEMNEFVDMMSGFGVTHKPDMQLRQPLV